MSLVEDAKNIKTGRKVNYGKDEMLLALAYINNELTAKQVEVVLKIKDGGAGVYVFAVRALREYTRLKGKLISSKADGRK